MSGERRAGGWVGARPPGDGWSLLWAFPHASRPPGQPVLRHLPTPAKGAGRTGTLPLDGGRGLEAETAVALLRPRPGGGIGPHLPLSVQPQTLPLSRLSDGSFFGWADFAGEVRVKWGRRDLFGALFKSWDREVDNAPGVCRDRWLQPGRRLKEGREEGGRPEGAAADSGGRIGPRRPSKLKDQHQPPHPQQIRRAKLCPGGRPGAAARPVAPGRGPAPFRAVGEDGEWVLIDFIFIFLAALPLTCGFTNLPESPDSSGFRGRKGQRFSSSFPPGSFLRWVSPCTTKGAFPWCCRTRAKQRPFRKLPRPLHSPGAELSGPPQAVPPPPGLGSASWEGAGQVFGDGR